MTLFHNTWLSLLNYCNDWFLNMINIRNLSRLTLIALFSSMLGVSHTIAESRIIHLVSTGWHVGIVMPLDAILKRNLPETKHFPNSKFLEVGWGDARFYKSKNPTARMAFEAAFTSKSSVIHIYAFQSPVNEAFISSEILKLELSKEGYSELLSFIHKSFVRTANGDAKTVGVGLHGEKKSRFYLSNGKFHLFNTCNTWIADALQSAKLDIRSQGIITADNLMEKVRELPNNID